MSSSGQGFQQSDIQAIVQLTRKLGINQQPGNRSSAGGLSRIPEGDSEMTASSGPAVMQAS
jgi:hypothetical protein